MARIKVELFTDQGNDAVIKLPERRFPGVVIQGDTLNDIVTCVRDALESLVRGEERQATSQLRELSARLGQAQLRYEDALRSRGIALPYPQAP